MRVGLVCPRNLRKLGWTVFICVAVAFSVAGTALGQDASARPAYAGEVVRVLDRVRWRVLDEGLSYLEVSTALGTRITALRVDGQKFRMLIAEQDQSTGERAAGALERLDAELAVNGGFFSMVGDENLNPVGMLIMDGNPRSKAWPRAGGYVALDDRGTPTITLSADGPPMWSRQAVQSKPVLIEPGGKWAMSSNRSHLKRRTLLCILKPDLYVLVLVHGGGLSLFEAGWILRARKWGGYFGCDSALALDGGGSTQLAVKGRNDLNIDGFTKVQNFLAVIKR